jgi:AcrR family transcriptional regulator
MSELQAQSSKILPKLPPSLRDAALALFAEFGYGATGIRDIARRTGMSSAAMYHYFGSKQDLLFELMHSIMVLQLEVTGAALQGVQGPEARIAALARTHVLLIASHILETFVNENEIRSLEGANRRKIVAMRDEYEDYWREAITQGVADGVFKVSDIKLASFAAIAMCTSVSRWYSRTGPMAPEQIAQTYADFILSMLRGGLAPRARLVAPASVRKRSGSHAR